MVIAAMMRALTRPRWLIYVAILLVVPPGVLCHALEQPPRTATLWTPVQEWSVGNPHIAGNPFDIEATATFTHKASGQTYVTGLYYDREDTWKFRFSPTITGEWTFETAGAEPGLHGHYGTVTVEANPNPRAHGFLTAVDANKWAWQTDEKGDARAFVPQLVMYKYLDVVEKMSDEEIKEDLRIWFDAHGFNGLHVGVMCRWFDFDKERHTEFDTDDPNPDPRTFVVLERLIALAHEAGGFVHIWKWGDEDRRMTPLRWGINGSADKRLQRYIAARLGPLPGWTIGYGFDLWEWVTAEQVLAWRQYMHEHLGRPQFIGGRAHAWHTPITKAITYELDYVGYEMHRPDYDKYVEALALKPDRPVFMEDRFRVRNSPTHRQKDYSLDDTRRGLWRSAMAGGVANIWGYLLPDDDEGASRPYPNHVQIRTYADFFARRFLSGMERDNGLTDGVCLRRGATHFLFYGEDTSALSMNLSQAEAPLPAVAIDTKTPYYEFDIGPLTPDAHTWEAPYASDWAVAVGAF